MRQYFAYIRVSTQKQGEKGVSLQEQRNAIEGYAQRNQLKVDRWFEERETAAKSGRPLFLEMLALLKKGKADGVLIHKIDRSARNLKDWADLGALIDRGVEVHFVNESLDLQSRGGRLSADIQAVVAADFIRNLREESRKGFYGRLKQGFYPLPAPLGYLDMGPAKAKEIDPVRAPLIRRAFELYASGDFTVKSLPAKLTALGLRNRRNGPVGKSVVATILSNPFYIGIIRLKTGETFEGNHPRIISPELFENVQALLEGRTIRHVKRHDYLYRRLITCKRCNLRLIGETQKGHTYYRCHTKSCETKCFREEEITQEVQDLFTPLGFHEDERLFLKEYISASTHDEGKEREREIAAISLTVQNIDSRLMKLTDAYVDGMLDKEAYLQRKEAFLMEKKNWEERRFSLLNGGSLITDQVRRLLEFTDRLPFRYKIGTTSEKREMFKIATSNRWADARKLDFSLSFPFSLIANRSGGSNGSPEDYENLEPQKTQLLQAETPFRGSNQHNSSPYRDTGRTLTGILPVLVQIIKEGKLILPDWVKKDESHEGSDPKKPVPLQLKPCWKRKTKDELIPEELKELEEAA